jgi:hypothetical protein
MLPLRSLRLLEITSTLNILIALFAPPQTDDSANRFTADAGPKYKCKYGLYNVVRRSPLQVYLSSSSNTSTSTNGLLTMSESLSAVTLHCY